MNLWTILIIAVISLCALSPSVQCRNVVTRANAAGAIAVISKFCQLHKFDQCESRVTYIKDHMIRAIEETFDISAELQDLKPIEGSVSLIKVGLTKDEISVISGSQKIRIRVQQLATAYLQYQDKQSEYLKTSEDRKPIVKTVSLIKFAATISRRLLQMDLAPGAALCLFQTMILKIQFQKSLSNVNTATPNWVWPCSRSQ
uniref:Secreted protein n=1 Tax=Spongospora subterranea TaxID=70186 RepID=A0A0H5QP76_9EUKA|eukprot:CRZ03402.1 hypothetical protein [Spongospora subterranea]